MPDRTTVRSSCRFQRCKRRVAAGGPYKPILHRNSISAANRAARSNLVCSASNAGKGIATQPLVALRPRFRAKIVRRVFCPLPHLCSARTEKVLKHVRQTKLFVKHCAGSDPRAWPHEFRFPERFNPLFRSRVEFVLTFPARWKTTAASLVTDDKARRGCDSAASVLGPLS